ncbi:hypothetical protein MCY90_04555 [Bacillus pumilus]|uniref:hypothetical protein n=1 Tax=Bacillus TaxID=1386 RepID=UPI002281C37A|nr:hypothetical protein [Bacillus pumilus]MCY7434619.1 hypothetical protein [Bacillus pumilus]
MSFQQIKDKLNQYTIEYRLTSDKTMEQINKIRAENNYNISSDYKSFISDYGEYWIEDNIYTDLKEWPVWLLEISEQDQGKIYFWDHELRDGEQDLFLIADTFTKFIESLFVVEEDDESDTGALGIQLSDDLLKMLKEEDKYLLI